MITDLSADALPSLCNLPLTLGDRFYWVVRPQDPGETQEHNSGLTTCFL